MGGTNARAHLFDEQLQSLGGAQTRIRGAADPEQMTETLLELLIDICDQAGVEPASMEAIGLGLAGQLSVDGLTVRNAPNLGWRDVPFAQLFKETLQKGAGVQPSVRLINDLNAQLWGEHLAGVVRGIQDVLAVYVGTGVGGAILSGGRLITGAGNNAGEIGHSKVVAGGRPCGCGEQGCVEAYAGGINLERRLAELLDSSPDPELTTLRTGNRIDLGAADKLAIDHPSVGQIWEEATDFLALIIANACTLLNPAALLIGGGVFENCHHFRSITLQKAIPLVLAVSREVLEVRQPSLGGLSGMLGAADLAMDRPTS